MNGEHEPLGKALAGSVLTHAAVVAAIFSFGFLNIKDHWGSEHASSGSVGVTMVKTIPIPRNQGPTNPLANDTKNFAPQQPTIAKPKPVIKAPEPDAIPLARKVEKRMKLTPKQEAATLFKPQDYKPNQVFSKTPQATSSNMYGIQGAGGIDIGPASVLGNRFGGYVDLMRRQISEHWNTASVNATPLAEMRGYVYHREKRDGQRRSDHEAERQLLAGYVGETRDSRCQSAAQPACAIREK